MLQVLVLERPLDTSPVDSLPEKLQRCVNELGVRVDHLGVRQPERERLAAPEHPLDAIGRRRTVVRRQGQAVSPRAEELPDHDDPEPSGHRNEKAEQERNAVHDNNNRNNDRPSVENQKLKTGRRTSSEADAAKSEFLFSSVLSVLSVLVDRWV